MRGPVMDALVEDRANSGVVLDFGVEVIDEGVDLSFGEFAFGVGGCGLPWLPL